MESTHITKTQCTTETQGSCLVCANQCTLRCKNCKSFYCSKEHQKMDWKRHKLSCVNTKSKTAMDAFREQMEISEIHDIIDSFQAPTVRAQLRLDLEKVSDDVKEFYSDCVKVMETAKCTGSGRTTFLDPKNRLWVCKKGAKLGDVKIRQVADLLKSYASSSAHPNQHEFNMDLRELYFALDDPEFFN